MLSDTNVYPLMLLEMLVPENEGELWKDISEWLKPEWSKN